MDGERMTSDQIGNTELEEDTRGEPKRDNLDGDRGGISTADIAYGRNDSGNSRASAEENDGRVDLVKESDAESYRERWTTIQTKFIDEPKDTVSQADELVAEVIQSLATRFADERQSLEGQWQSGSEVSTEDLRMAMQRYRSFFERLLAA